MPLPSVLKRLAAVALCTFVFTSVAAGQDQLLVNPGFESATSGWIGGTATSIKPHSGSSCAYVKHLQSCEQTIAVEPGRNYTFSLWLKFGSNGDVGAMGVKDFGGVTVETSVTGDSWQQYSVSFTAVNSQATVYFKQGSGWQWLYGDDASLTCNDCGSTQPPTIVTQPVNVIGHENGSVIFFVDVSGTAPFQYRWFRDGTAIADSDNDTLTVPNLECIDDGSSFHCEVQNAVDVVYSNSATIDSVIPGTPEIISQPQDAVGSLASYVMFQFEAYACNYLPVVSFQWYRNDTLISGATKSVFDFYVDDETNGTEYYCIASTDGGSVQSRTAVLSVPCDDIYITAQPSNVSLNSGDNATFSVTAQSANQLTYRWFKNNIEQSNTNSATYTFGPVNCYDQGTEVFAIISNECISDTTATVRIDSVVPAPPVILSSPSDETVNLYDWARFEIMVEGECSFSMQWYHNGQAVSGETRYTYEFPANLSHNGDAIWCEVYNDGGSVFSDTAYLTVINIDSVRISIDIDKDTICPDDSVLVSWTIWNATYANITDNCNYNSFDINPSSGSIWMYPCAGSDYIAGSILGSSASGAINESFYIHVLPDCSQKANSEKLAVSGELYDDSGYPVGDASPESKDMTIRLFDAATGGTAVYAESFLAIDTQDVLVDGGLFTAYLGEGTSSDDLSSVIANNKNLWVEITIEDGSGPMTPRAPLTAAPYSLAPSNVLSGSGSPVIRAIEAPLGTFYVNTDDNTTWMKLNAGWKLMDL